MESSQVKSTVAAVLTASVLCAQPVAAGWDVYQHLSSQGGSWTVHDRKAGVTGADNGRSFLLASVHCVGENADALRLSFGSQISQFYRLYFVSELVPAIQANKADLTISVDGTHSFPLQYHNASIDNQNRLITSGMVMSHQAESKAMDALMAGRQVTFNLSYNGSLLLTEKFTLSNSADALNSLHCPDSSTTVADTRDAAATDQAL